MPNETTDSSQSERGSDASRSRQFALQAARLMHTLHCTDVVALDVRGLSQVTDMFVIGSGTSNRQMKSVADDLDELAEDLGLEVFRRHTDAQVTWIVIDFVDVVVHLFEPTVRAYYDLEMLWGDAERLAWREEPQAEPSVSDD
ncbi:MAG: ribosome silencing factor [Phycisphaerales bacterium JB038]